MIIGIDLGTSNSMAAVYKDGEVQLIPNSTGSFVTPSVVSVDEDGTFHTGEVAKERSVQNPGQAAQRFKRSMGTAVEYEIGKLKLKPEELSAIILKGIKEDASKFLKKKVKDAIISVPAFFNNLQREAVIKAGELAGLNVKKIINEPTSAAMAYGIENDDKEEKAIIVLDLGGGTFDISIMEVSGSVMEVVAICGDNKLGGNDFTDRLVGKFISDNGLEESISIEDKNALWKAAEKGKIEMSDKGAANIKCTINNIHYSMEITEEEYENICFDLLEKIRHLTIRAIDESKYLAEEIRDIVLVGGGTKLSVVKKMMEKMIDKELNYSINPDEAVVRGAAMQGAMMEKNEDLKELVMTDICPYYILEKINKWVGDEFVTSTKIFIEKNTTIPTKVKYTRDMYSGSRLVVLYQSEDKDGINATRIGECKYIVPEIETDSCLVEQTIAYDNNGIIRFETYIPAVNKTYKSTIMSDGSEVEDKGALTAQEINVVTGEKEANNLLIAKADNIYAELTGSDRNKLSEAIAEFEEAINTNKKSVIKQARIKLEDMIEKYKG